MCKIIGRDGTANLVVIPALVKKISKENERGLEIALPQVGRGLRNRKLQFWTTVNFEIEYFLNEETEGVFTDWYCDGFP